MKRIAFIAAAALLLTGCQSKKEICARLSANEMTYPEARSKLGLKPEGVFTEVDMYCQYYKR